MLHPPCLNQDCDTEGRAATTEYRSHSEIANVIPSPWSGTEPEEPADIMDFKLGDRTPRPGRTKQHLKRVDCRFLKPEETVREAEDGVVQSTSQGYQDTHCCVDPNSLWLSCSCGSQPRGATHCTEGPHKR